jgi:hypothetical protein
MFGIFKKKAIEDALDEDTVALAGITAGIAFKITEKKLGFTPVNETQQLIDDCKKAAYQNLSITPDERSRTMIHMVALAFAMDETGFAHRIVNRYQQGDKDIDRGEVQKIWDLTLKQIKQATEHFSKNGKR